MSDLFLDHVPEPDGDLAQDITPGHIHALLLRVVGVRNAEQTARSAAASYSYPAGRCLQWVRTRAFIAALWPDAATAWEHAERRHFDRKIPRGGFGYWVGGSRGLGHIAVSLGDEQDSDPWMRSTDAGGVGINATRRLSWFDAHWPGLHFVGWADNTNGVTVPGVEGDWFDMAGKEDLRDVVREEINRPQYLKKVAQETQKAVWSREMRVENADGAMVVRSTADLLKGTWERITRILKRSP